MDLVLSQFLMQLVARSPTLLVYLVGLILALVFWRRLPRPCLLVCLAMSLAMLVSIVSAFLFIFLVCARQDFGMNDEQFSWLMSASNIAATILHAVAIAILLAAVFVGRRAYAPPWPPEEERAPGPATGVETRIQS